MHVFYEEICVFVVVVIVVFAKYHLFNTQMVSLVCVCVCVCVCECVCVSAVELEFLFSFTFIQYVDIWQI
jgi:hypothetical protein